MAARSTKPPPRAEAKAKRPAANKTAAKKAGAPRKRIDLDELEKLAELQCTYNEAAAFFDVSRDTIIRRMKEDTFRERWEAGQQKGLISLRRTQFRLAEKNATMAIFLGKQYLGQRDVQEIAGARDGEPIPIEIRQRAVANLVSAVASLRQCGPNPDDEGEGDGA